jgi:hypothetical protein
VLKILTSTQAPNDKGSEQIADMPCSPAIAGRRHTPLFDSRQSMKDLAGMRHGSCKGHEEHVTKHPTMVIRSAQHQPPYWHTCSTPALVSTS